MAIKTATVTLNGDGLRFAGRSGSGHEVVTDDETGDAGMRPSELLPLALAACSGMDVISILRKKRQTVSSYAIETSGTQDDEHPNAFTAFELTHVVEGRGVDPEAVRRAVELSATKYCAVAATLSGAVPIEHRYVVRDVDAGTETAAHVLTTAPLGASTPARTTADAPASTAPRAAITAA